MAEAGAVDGLGGIELELTDGDQGDKEIGFEVVDNDGFFYDPRSYRSDFTDARYMGMGKWVDVAAAIEMFPDKKDELETWTNSGIELTSNSDRDNRWFAAGSGVGMLRRIRLIDIWYRHRGVWNWCIFTGASKLMEGVSYLHDEKKQTMCKFLMFSAYVDHAGDRYGFVRNLKSANDEINQRRSKALHEQNSRRIIAEQGAFDDVERTRIEAARPDGVIIHNPGTEMQFDDTARIANIEGSFKFLEDAKAEIENFGPNPALLGQGLDNSSGRAIALLQQAGIAELGPYILSYRGWKVRVYRALWNSIREHWTAQRWIRVTDDEGLAQFVQVNAMGVGQDGMPAIINQLGALDVDIILDEGPDSVNMQQDNYMVLQSLGPQFAMQFPEIALELAPMQGSLKKRMLDKINAAKQAPPPPDPKVMAAQAMLQLKQQEAQADMQIQGAKAQADLQFKAQGSQQDMGLRQQQAQLDAQLQAQKSQQELEIERVKAASEIQIAREKAQNDAELAAHKANVDASLSADKQMREDQRAAQKHDGEQRVAGEQKQHREQSDHVLASALTAVAHAVTQSSAPRTIRKGKDGSYRAEIG